LQVVFDRESWQDRSVACHQTHRGPAPQDVQLFGTSYLLALRAAAADLCWLLDRGYASRSAVELAGNRYALTARQRMAVARCACSRQDAEKRQQHRIESTQLQGQELWIDGYNVLAILESALAGGIVLLGRDRCCRDIAGIHRRYRKVKETIPVLRMVGEATTSWGVPRCRWWLDKPVSNSGRLKALILDVAAQAGWRVDVELSFNPDRVLSETTHVIATSDGMVLNRCQRWVNLARLVIAQWMPETQLLDLLPVEEQGCSREVGPRSCNGAQCAV
jgi:hypothetical protein